MGDRKRRFLFFLIITCIGFSLPFMVGCVDEDDSDSPGTSPEVVTGLFSTRGDVGFFDAPFPSPHMLRDDGTVKWARFPNPKQNILVQSYLDQADRHTQGFSRMGAIYLPFDGPVNESNLPADLFAGLNENAQVFLVNIDPASSDYNHRSPVYCRFQADATPYIPDNILMLLPFQGLPLAENAVHAAIVLTTLGDSNEHVLNQAPALTQMRQGEIPDGYYGRQDADTFEYLWDWCAEQGVDPAAIATASVFRTGDFSPEMVALQQAATELEDPEPFALSLLEEYEGFYVIEGRMEMPIWQDGDRPYWWEGGEIHFENGKPVLQWTEEVRFSLTIPKGQMPEGGFPLLFYANGQGGKYTQIIDRGGVGELAEVPGTGPAREFAARGIACLDIEAATVGPRHPTGSYEGLAFFNFLNLVAFRDNTRQAAAEFTTLPKMARHLRIPSGLVPETQSEADEIVFDEDHFYFWGHSTGASIGELVLAVEPAYQAGMFSGAGVSWIYNLVVKQSPIPFELPIRILTGSAPMDRFHPLATLFQNMIDPAEAAYFAEHWHKKPLHEGLPDVLLIYGIFDGFFPPIMIDGLMTAGGLDLVAPLEYPPAFTALELGELSFLDAPVSGNIEYQGRKTTAVTAQFATPVDVNGHYAPFYLDEAKYLYTCFFKSLELGAAAVLPHRADETTAPCN